MVLVVRYYCIARYYKEASSFESIKSKNQINDEKSKLARILSTTLLTRELVESILNFPTPTHYSVTVGQQSHHTERIENTYQFTFTFTFTFGLNSL